LLNFVTNTNDSSIKTIINDFSNKQNLANASTKLYESLKLYDKANSVINQLRILLTISRILESILSENFCALIKDKLFYLKVYLGIFTNFGAIK